MNPLLSTERQPIFPQFSDDLFSVVTLNNDLLFPGVTLQNIHLCEPLYPILSNVTFSLHRHIKPFTPNRALL